MAINVVAYVYSKWGQPSFPTKILIGMIAGGIGAFIGTPAEVALIRMTADGRLPPEKKRNYKNVFNALARSNINIHLSVGRKFRVTDIRNIVWCSSREPGLGNLLK